MQSLTLTRMIMRTEQWAYSHSQANKALHCIALHRLDSLLFMNLFPFGRAPRNGNMKCNAMQCNAHTHKRKHGTIRGAICIIINFVYIRTHSNRSDIRKRIPALASIDCFDRLHVEQPEVHQKIECVEKWMNVYLQRCLRRLALVAARVAGRWVRLQRSILCDWVRLRRRPHGALLWIAATWFTVIVVVRWTQMMRFSAANWRGCNRRRWRTVATSWRRFCTSDWYAWTERCRFSYRRHFTAHEPNIEIAAIDSVEFISDWCALKQNANENWMRKKTNRTDISISKPSIFPSIWDLTGSRRNEGAQVHVKSIIVQSSFPPVKRA